MGTKEWVISCHTQLLPVIDGWNATRWRMADGAGFELRRGS